MKKIIVFLVLALFITFGVASFFATPAKKASAEELPTTETETETPEIPETPETPTNGEETGTETEKTPTVTLTQEELTEIINNALTEQQKQIADGIAGKIASVLGIDYNTVYLFVAGALVIILLVAVLLTKYLTGRGAVKSLQTQLKAQQSAYSVLSQSKEDLNAILQNFSAEELGKMLNKVITDNTDTIVNAVTDKIVKNLKIEDNTIAELAGEGKVIVEIGYALKEALIAIAENNRDLAIKRLSASPTVEAVNALALENEKLKTALGDEAVAKVLGITETAVNKGA